MLLASVLQELALRSAITNKAANATKRQCKFISDLSGSGACCAHRCAHVFDQCSLHIFAGIILATERRVAI